jgi:hypothetical protein
MTRREVSSVAIDSCFGHLKLKYVFSIKVTEKNPKIFRERNRKKKLFCVRVYAYDDIFVFLSLVVVFLNS